RCVQIVNEVHPDLLYLQSFFDPVFTLYPLWLRRLDIIPRNIPVLIAPRGEFSPGALQSKAKKKQLFIRCAKVLNLYRDVFWHATSEEEAALITDIIPGAKVTVVSNLASPPGNVEQLVRTPKATGSLRMVFLSRITPKKNLRGALEVLARVRA